MGKNNHFQPKRKRDFRRGKKSLELRKDGLAPKKYIVFSLRYLDQTQGQTPQKWEDENFLAKAINRIQAFSSMTVTDAIKSQALKFYGKKIPKGSNYKHPKYLDDDIEWASLRIQGKERIIGFIESDFIFNIESTVESPNSPKKSDFG